MKRLALLVATFLPSALATAGGFEYPDLGPVAMGRGSAFTAKADDGTAIYYNPSGLADQDGWRVLVSAQFLNQAETYQRTDATGALVGPAVSNTSGILVLPFLAVSKQVLPGLTFAAGVFPPPANGNLNFQDESPPVLTAAQKLQILSHCSSAASLDPNFCPGATTGSLNTAPEKYQLISQNILILYPTVAAAWSPIPFFAIGGSLQLEYANTNLRRATFDGSRSEAGTHSVANEVLTYDTIANIAVTGTTITGIFGATIHPLPQLKIGASFRPKHTLTQSGTLKLDFSPLAQGSSAAVSGPGTSNAANGASGSGPMTLTNTFPGELKTGIDYDFGIWDLEVDFNYNWWSDYTSAVITPQFSQSTLGNAATQVPAVIIQKVFQDTWALRLGGDVRIPVPVGRLTVRAGVGYESSPYDTNKPQFVTVDYANFEEYYGAVGATVGLGAFDVDLSYSHVFMPQHDVRNSGYQATQNNTPAVDMVVANGNYQTGYDLFALGARAHF